MSENHNIYTEIQEKTESFGIGFSVRQKTRNLCCFLIAYSGFPKLKAYGKIGQNLKERKFFEMKKGLKKNRRGAIYSSCSLPRYLQFTKQRAESKILFNKKNKI